MPLPRVQLSRRILPIAAAQAVGVLCGILGVAIVSRWVPPASLGSYGLYLTFTTLGMWLVHSGLIKFLNRHWGAEPARAALLRRLLEAWLRKLPWLLAAAAVGAWYITHVSGPSFGATIGPLFLSAAVLSLTAAAQAALQADRAHNADFVVSAAGSIGRTFAAPWFFVLSGGLTVALFWGFAAHAVLVSGIAIAFLLRAARQPPLRPGGAGEPSADVYLGPLFALLALASWSLNGVTRWIFAWQFDEVSTGYFTFAGSVGALVPAVLGGITVQYFQPGIYALADQPSPDRAPAVLQRIDLIVLGLTTVGLVGLLGLRLLAPHLIGWLIHPRYAPALSWIVPAGCFTLTTTTMQFYSILLLAMHREKSCGRVELISATVLVAAAIAAAAFGSEVFWWTLTATPVVTWLVSRRIARYELNR